MLNVENLLKLITHKILINKAHNYSFGEWIYILPNKTRLDVK
jgi:hypothetical protein